MPRRSGFAVLPFILNVRPAPTPRHHEVSELDCAALAFHQAAGSAVEMQRCFAPILADPDDRDHARTARLSGMSGPVSIGPRPGCEPRGLARTCARSGCSIWPSRREEVR
jgi:hypothetical protein